MTFSSENVQETSMKLSEAIFFRSTRFFFFFLGNIMVSMNTLTGIRDEYEYKKHWP